MKEDLEKEKAQKSILEEREKLSRELHDGIAQSLFLVSVKFNQLELKEPQLNDNEVYQKIKKTIQHIHTDVRQAIFNLRNATHEESFHWRSSLNTLIANFKEESKKTVNVNWEIDESIFSAKEKIELYACIKEALMNIRKHAKCENVWISARTLPNGWICKIEDDGLYIRNGKSSAKGYGLEIMKDRTNSMGWNFSLERNDEKTQVIIRKGNYDETTISRNNC
ncbi:histidine kinase [Anaerobacillus sp. CMMVII]|uniref:sensor histidine kinase n=1 Tax=Anaerobacillus sp. CMMVII TaxID=2755588 RepID=UPI0028E0A1C7|nr:histidine kinase [Anaerobacillus sp. CMMVII]